MVPVWLPLLAAAMLGAQAAQSPIAIALLLAPFVFIPGLYVLANMAVWSRSARLLACMAYLVVGAVTAFKLLEAVLPLLA